MDAKKKKITAGGVIAWLLGLACALVLGAVFYGAMAYQLSGAQGSQTASEQATPAPLAPGGSSASLYPGALLSLAGAELVQEKAEDAAFGGQTCRVIARTYALPSGVQAQAVSAYPAAYLERLSQEGYVSQLITGFSLAGMDAVYAVRGEEALLAAADADCVYMIAANADEQTMYALGASAYLE